MIILRLFKILRHPDTSLKSILNVAAAYVLIRNRQLIRRERVFRDRLNPLDYMDDCDILEKFRLPRHVIFDLCNELNDRLEHPAKRSHALPTSLPVMVALRFYASGSFQAVYAYLHGISKANDLSANKVAQQYTTFSACQSCVASIAVDRDIQTCTRMEEIGSTSLDKSTWWYVDLGGIYNLYNIRIQFKDYGGYTMRQRGRFAGFFLYVSNTTDRHMGHLCYKDGPELPPLDFNTNCITHGRYVIFYNERLPGKIYPMGYENTNVFTELCEVIVTGCSSSGVYGGNCDQVCPETCQYRRCDIINGTCLGCTPGWLGARCNKACPVGYYGLLCESKCVGHCKDSAGCNHTSGLCDKGCDDGWTGWSCTKECPIGTFGPDCVHKCSGNCFGDVACNRTTGMCDTGCDIGYTGVLCDTGCEIGKYGKDCSVKCSGHCLDNVSCNSTTGHCDGGCDLGYVEPLCNKFKNDLESNALRESCNEASYIAGLSVLGIICIMLGSVCLFLMWKQYKLVKKMRSQQYISIIRTSTQDNNADNCQQYEELRI